MVHGENDLPIYHHMHLITILAAAVLANSPRTHIICLNMKRSWLTWIGTSLLKKGADWFIDELHLINQLSKNMQ